MGGYCEADGENDGYEEYEEKQTYVIKRLMLPAKQQDETQQHQLFRARCTINNDILNIIIDGGNCENIISKQIVKSLKLSFEKYTQPYNIGWIKLVGQILMLKRCKVSFSIGKYKNKVYCDTIDTDVCQLLFGRPW